MEHDYADVVELTLKDKHVLAAHAKARASMKRGNQDEVYTPADDLP